MVMPVLSLGGSGVVSVIGAETEAIGAETGGAALVVLLIEVGEFVKAGTALSFSGVILDSGMGGKSAGVISSATPSKIDRAHQGLLPAASANAVRKEQLRFSVW